MPEPTQPTTCPTCNGAGYIEGDFCTSCYGGGSLPVIGVMCMIAKKVVEGNADVLDKCNDILDKCNDILNKLNE